MSVIRSLVVCLIVFAAGRAGAQACPAPPRPFVNLTADVLPPDQRIVDALRARLDEELDARGIDLCEGYEGEAVALARVELVVARPGDGSVSATIRLGDRLTDKRVERTLDLTEVPADAHPLAVAVAADELLRASWAEVHITDAPPTGVEVPREVLAALASTMRDPQEALEEHDRRAAERAARAPPREWEWEVGLLGSALLFERLEAFGGQVYGAWWPHPHVQITVDLEASFSLRRAAPTGSVRAERLGGHVGGAFAFWPRTSVAGLAAELALGVLRMQFVPRGDTGVVEMPFASVVVEARGGLRGWVLADPIRLTFGVAAIVAIRPATATDEGDPIVSTDRVGGEATLGAAVVF